MAGRASLEKATFSLPSDLLREMREMVSDGVAPSQNALMRRALERELRDIRVERLRREFEEAAQDPLFMRDLEETEQAFSTADAQTARMIPNG